VKSRHGAEMYYLHDEGIKLAETQSELTPLQRRFYLKAREYYNEKEKEKMEREKRKAKMKNNNF
jgi:hypothetical protein